MRAAKPLNVLIGCEESGTVREAFRALGHNAWSCDLLPARDLSPYHLTGDVRHWIKFPPSDTGGGHLQPVDHWDLGIFHPTCTYLCNSGVRWLTTIPKIQKPGVFYGPVRRAPMVEACQLFVDLLCAKIPRIAIENPIMHGHARAVIVDLLMRQRGITRAEAEELSAFDQTVQPHQFGDRALKRTGLVLLGLPPLEDTDYIEPPPVGSAERRKWSEVHQASPGPTRARDRSVTYPGIARAMAAQWGGDARGGRS